MGYFGPEEGLNSVPGPTAGADQIAAAGGPNLHTPAPAEGGKWTAAVLAIHSSLAAGQLRAARVVFDQMVSGEFGPPPPRPAQAGPDRLVHGYHWDEVSDRTGFEPADLHGRILGWLPGVPWLTPDGRCTQAGLDELMRQAASEGDVAATAEETAYLYAAARAREFAVQAAPSGAGVLPVAAVEKLAGDLDGLAAFAMQTVEAGRSTARLVTWADVVAGTDLDAEELAAVVTPLLASLTADGRPTQATIDVIRARRGARRTDPAESV